MTTIEPILPEKLSRVASSVLALLLVASLSVTPALAQDQSEQQQQQLEQLKQEYAQAVQAAEQNDASTAIEHFEAALELARATEQDGAAQKIQQYLVDLPRQWGNDALKNENNEQALEHFEQGLEYGPEEPRLHYGKGLALIRLEQEEEAIESLMQAIELSQQTGNQRIAQTAAERIRGHYVSLASQALNAQNPSRAQASQAIEYLDEMEEYVDPNANAYFYRATALYHLNQFEEAIAAARQGLQLFNGSRSDQAKYHFVIGESYVALDNVEAAKEEFRQAAYGDYQARAEHYLETL